MFVPSKLIKQNICVVQKLEIFGGWELCSVDNDWKCIWIVCVVTWFAFESFSFRLNLSKNFQKPLVFTYICDYYRYMYTHAHHQHTPFLPPPPPPNTHTHTHTQCEHTLVDEWVFVSVFKFLIIQHSSFLFLFLFVVFFSVVFESFFLLVSYTNLFLTWQLTSCFRFELYACW